MSVLPARLTWMTFLLFLSLMLPLVVAEGVGKGAGEGDVKQTSVVDRQGGQPSLPCVAAICVWEPETTTAETVILVVISVFCGVPLLGVLLSCCCQRLDPVRAEYNKVPRDAEGQDSVLVNCENMTAFAYLGVPGPVGPTHQRKDILVNINLQMCRGEMIALMGPSGAGKSTMLDILSLQSKRGIQMEGVVEHRGLAKCNVMHMHQEDVFPPTISTGRYLRFWVDMKLGCASSEEREMVVTLLLRSLSMSLATGTMIGGELPGGIVVSGISGGQRKRLSFACNVIANPTLFILDEVTSGLDAYSAMKVIDILRYMTQKQRKTIVCAIHQPRLRAYLAFDRVLLLSAGYLALDDNPDDSATVVERIAKVHMDKRENPGNFIVDTISQFNRKQVAKLLEWDERARDARAKDEQAKDEQEDDPFFALPPAELEADAAKGEALERKRVGKTSPKMSGRISPGGSPRLSPNVSPKMRRKNWESRSAGRSRLVSSMLLVNNPRSRLSQSGILDGSPRSLGRSDAGGEAEEPFCLPRTASFEEVFKKEDEEEGDIGAFVMASSIIERTSGQPASFFNRLITLVKWQFLLHISNPTNLLMRWAAEVVIGILFGLMALDALNTGRGGVKALINASYLGFVALLLLPVAVITVFQFNRQQYTRERKAVMYGSVEYYISFMMVEIFTEVATGTVLALIMWAIIGLREGAEYLIYYIMLLCCFSFSCIAYVMLCALLAPNFDIALAAVCCIQAIFQSTSGIGLPPSELTWAIRWFSYINPMRYAFQGFIINQFHDLEYDCTATGECAIYPNGNAVINILYLDDVMANKWYCLWCILLFGIVLHYCNWLTLHVFI
mmetsp:Transcript_22572/g.63379  ORF Transcript_22572/g.63379 Transcript_22572/m.63379 type:complete len:842 (+) Transcript_22572:146-2671(+)